MNLEDLKAPFDPKDIEWRIGRSGINGGGKVWAMALAYLQNRAVMNRLDEVCGPENWKNEFKEWNVGGPGVLCGISIRTLRALPTDEWVTKWDGVPTTDFEAVKGGLSDAMKRAAVQWGVGRYLYNLEETFVETSLEKRQGWKYAKTGDKAFWWKEPILPDWALPTFKQQMGYEAVSNDQASVLWALIRGNGFDVARYLSWASKASKRHVNCVEETPATIYEKAKALLEAEGGKT